eukprot:14881630-Alexandrium_andersonii.AAC.1
MRGHRLSELACGDFFEFFRSACEQSLADLLLHLPPAISDAHKAVCIANFERGRGFLLFEFTMKLSCYLEAPLRLFGMAHADRSKAELSIQ